MFVDVVELASRFAHYNIVTLNAKRYVKKACNLMPVYANCRFVSVQKELEQMKWNKAVFVRTPNEEMG